MHLYIRASGHKKGLKIKNIFKFIFIRKKRVPINSILFSVDGEGFEPSKSETADLQSDPFGHSGTHPKIKPLLF